MKTLTAKEQKELTKLIAQALQSPPTIGVVGVSGVGKSSTINAMFRTNLPISHTVACTKEFRSVPLQLEMIHGPATGQGVPLVVYDAPGLGEDISKDPEYIRMYKERLPKCDIVLWVMSARNRAIALDQSYLSMFPELQDRIVFGLSQVDLVEPMHWKKGSPIPFGKQQANITSIVADRTERLSQFLGRKIDVVPYSNAYGYNLEGLFTSMLQSCKKERSWIFHSLKNFSYEDFIEKTEKSAMPRINNSTMGKKQDYANLENIPNRRQRKSLLRRIWDEIRNITSIEEPTDFVEPLPQNIKPHLKDIIGRDNVAEVKLSSEEREKIAQWIKTQKLKSNF